MAATTPSVERAGNGARSSAALNFLKASPKKLLIGGKWVAAKSGKTFETLNPATEEVLGLIAEGDKADVDEAVKWGTGESREAAKQQHELYSTWPVDSSQSRTPRTRAQHQTAPPLGLAVPSYGPKVCGLQRKGPKLWRALFACSSKRTSPTKLLAAHSRLTLPSFKLNCVKRRGR